MKTTIRGDYLPQLEPSMEVMLYRTSQDGVVAVAVESPRGIAWDCASDRFCGDAAILTVIQALHIMRSSLFSPQTFHVIAVNY